MTQHYRFTAPDTWTPLDDDLWLDGDSDGSMAQRHGYKDGETMLGEESALLATTLHEDSKQLRWLVVITLPSCSLITVELPTFPDMMAYLARYGTVPLLAQARDDLAAMDARAEKRFRAEHGHAGYNVCRECDPSEYAERRREERRAQAAYLASLEEGTAHA